MGLFHRIWAAFGRIADSANAVADNLSGLAETFKQANHNVRQNLHLDEPPAQAAPVPALTAQAAQPEATAEPDKPKKRRNNSAA